MFACPSRRRQCPHQEYVHADLVFNPPYHTLKDPFDSKAAWEAADNEPVSQVSTTPAEPLPKRRLQSFETTDSMWAGPLLHPVDFKRDAASEDSLETAPIDRPSPRKELRRPPTKGSEKLKNKIKKLKGFWKEKQRMMPHLFKIVFREESGWFELHDLSLKGAAGGKAEADGTRDELDADQDDELSLRLSDLNKDTLFAD